MRALVLLLGLCLMAPVVWAQNRCGPGMHAIFDKDDGTAECVPISGNTSSMIYASESYASPGDPPVDDMECKLECEVQYDEPLQEVFCFNSPCRGEVIHNGDKLCQLWCKQKPKIEPARINREDGSPCQPGDLVGYSLKAKNIVCFPEKASCDKQIADAARRFVQNGWAYSSAFVELVNRCKD